MSVFEPMRAAWGQRPFQGQCPEVAKVFFFGKDANYDSNITNDFLTILKQYHDDGAAYWLNNWQNNNNNDHHPFLLPMFRQGAGYKYHSTFRMIDLPADSCAEAVSFVELLNVPTTDIISDEEFEQLLQDSLENGHITRLQDSILNAQNKLVFMPDEVIRNLKKINRQHGLFHGLNYSQVNAHGLPIIYHNADNNITVRKYLHLSALRYHRNRVIAQLPIVRQLVLDFLGRQH